jgi:hypothetical protein
MNLKEDAAGPDYERYRILIDLPSQNARLGFENIANALATSVESSRPTEAPGAPDFGFFVMRRSSDRSKRQCAHGIKPVIDSICCSAVPLAP